MHNFKDVCLNYVYIFGIWLLWYACSSLSTLTNKSLLSIFPYPLTATTNQLLHTSIYSLFLSKAISHLTIAEIFNDVKSNRKSFLILGFINGATIALFHFGLSILSAAYIHTIKTAVPLFVVVFSRLIGKRYSYKTYLALLTIIAGVAVTSKTEVTFTVPGLVVGLLSTMGSAAFNVYMKMVLDSSRLHKSNVLFVISGISLLWIFPLWIFVDLRGMVLANKKVLYSQIRRGGYYFLLDGIFRCSQNFMAIIMLAKLSALGYSVASVVKRLFVILTAIVFFATPSSPLTYFGLCLTMVGLLWYNLIKEQSPKSSLLNREVVEEEKSEMLKGVLVDKFFVHNSPIRNLA